MRRCCKLLLIALSALTVFYIFRLQSNETVVIKEGFYVSRLDGLFGLKGKTKYTVNFTTGLEDIDVRGSTYGDPVYIVYDSVNNKVISIVYPDDHLYFGLLDNGQVTKSHIRIYTEVSYESVEHHFERALVIRNKVRERFSQFFKKEPVRITSKDSNMKTAQPSPSQ